MTRNDATLALEPNDLDRTHHEPAREHLWQETAHEAVDCVLRHSDRLGEHHRELLLAMAAWLRGDHTAADQQYRLILAAHPDDAEAWNMLGELTLHKGYLLGRAWVDARAAYERVLALDPGSAWSLWWLAAIAVREAGAPISTR